MKPRIPLLLLATALLADVSFSAVFPDHAVLQTTRKVPVWGKAEPCETVVVTMDSVNASRWEDG